MSKTPYLIHRRQTESASKLPVSLVAGRRFLFGPAAVLALLTLSAFPLSAADNQKAGPPAAPAAVKSALRGAPESPLPLGKTMRFNLPAGADYQIQEGSAQVQVEKGDGYLLLTPLEAGRVALTVNNIPFAVRVMASAQTSAAVGTGGTTPGITAPSTTEPPAATAPGTAAPPAPGTTVPAATAPGDTSVPTLVPVAPTTPLSGPTTTLPALAPTVPTSVPVRSSVPSGMAPLPSPPRVSPSLPPPPRTPARAPYPTRAVSPQNMPSGPSSIKIINVTKGLASLLSFQRNILSVYFSDATVMDARAINARTLAVTGVLPGKSTLAVFTATPGDDAVGQLHMFHIVVEQPTALGPQPAPLDPQTVETAIRSAINDPRIQVMTFQPGDGTVAVRLTGRVRDEVERKAAEETAALYATKVINGIIISPDAMTFDQAFAPPEPALTPEELAQNQLRLVTGNQTIELSPLGGSWVLKGEVRSQAEAQQLMTLASALNQKIVPLIVVRGPGGITPAEQPITTPEDREMSRRFQEVTGITTVYATRTAQNGIAVYGTVRNRMEFDRVQRYKNVLPVIATGGGGGSNMVETNHPTHAYQSSPNVQIFVRIDDPAESGLRLVTIDSNVVEISRTSLKNLGVEFGSAQLLTESSSPGSTSIVDGNIVVTPPSVTRTLDPAMRMGSILAGNGFGGTGGFGIIDPFRARLNAIYQNGNANILSKPNVTTLEGTEAQITIGGARPIPEIQTTGQAGNIQESINFRRFGIILTMRPTVLADDTIILQVRVDVTDLDLESGITRGNTFIPGETVRSVNNVLVLKEGDIIALGGLISNAKRKVTSRVPILSQIPILGALFQSRRFENNESELAIFLTPSIKRVPVNSELTEYGLHASSWPKLSGINDGQSAFTLSSVAGGSGSGGK